ncbi:hypothetical protein ACJJIK_05365 [Microbulbifer sp. ZKSA006]|uniref:hypothetical protein n=1 Tax=Microbulbifer sp. ZKSA006 TaxID=3243390 RepID=UPI0040393D70
MKKRSQLIVVVAYLGLGACFIHLLGEFYATKMMEVLTENPSPDLYANDHGFQYVAFWFPWGMALAFLLILSAVALHKNLGRTRAKNT